MPHECTTCGRTFEDGSKEMLSGCPDCGGNKFQFHPGGSATDISAGQGGDTGPTPTARNQTPESGQTPADSPQQEAPTSTGSSLEATDSSLDDSDTSASASGVKPGDSSFKFDSDGSTVNSNNSQTAADPGTTSAGSRTATDGELIGEEADDRADNRGARGSNPEQNSAAQTESAPSEPTDMIPEQADREDSAQANARRTIVADHELPREEELDSPPEPSDSDAGSEASDAGTDPPDLSDLRQELNEQFESIKIHAPGEYELNLMELYDREEHIIALQEDGRYVIDVPNSWRDGEDEA